MNIQEHLMDLLIEECAEVIKETSKGLRFGLDDRNVLNPTGPTNRERTILELNDLMAVIEMCVDYGVLPRDWAQTTAQEAKKKKVLEFMVYAHRVGALAERSVETIDVSHLTPAQQEQRIEEWRLKLRNLSGR